MSESPSLPSTLVSVLDIEEHRLKTHRYSLQMQRLCAHQIHKSKRKWDEAQRQFIGIRNQFHELVCELRMRMHSISDVAWYNNLKREKECWLERLWKESASFYFWLTILSVWVQSAAQSVSYPKLRHSNLSSTIKSQDLTAIWNEFVRCWCQGRKTIEVGKFT